MEDNRREQDVEDLADDLEAEADRMESDVEEVGQHVDETRDEWDRKRSDDAVPGAEPPFSKDTPGGEDDEQNPAMGEGSPAG